MTLLEVDEAANAISAQVDPDANIIFGAAFDPTLVNTLRVSVVATGMDGMSISAIEPAPRRSTAVHRPEPAVMAPIPEPEPEPVLQLEPEVAPLEPVMEVREIAPEPQPAPIYQPPRIEPVRPVVQPSGRAYPTSESYAEAEMAFEPPPPAPEPRITPPQSRSVPRIIDPSVADDEDPEPLFPEASHFANERRQKGGWLSIFGRPRQDAPQQPPTRQNGAGPSGPQLIAEAPVDESDDLEIPSFLRRLAN